MIKIENYDVFNFENAIRGMRNPLSSWDKSDSQWIDNEFVIGKNDLSLAKKLIKSGSTHRKFMRQIFVSADITAPLYLWKEIDQYRIAVTTDSCSTMHTIHKQEFSLDDFSIEHLHPEGIVIMKNIIQYLNTKRQTFLVVKDPDVKKDYWWQLIQILPSTYNQMRTWTGNYENLISMYHDRKHHKLDEWKEVCAWIETLPYAKELIVGETDGQD